MLKKAPHHCLKKIFFLFFIVMFLNPIIAQTTKQSEEKNNINKDTTPPNKQIINKTTSNTEKKTESQNQNESNNDIQKDQGNEQETDGNKPINMVILNTKISIKIGEDKALAKIIEKKYPYKNKNHARSTKIIHKFKNGITEIVNAGSKSVFFVAGNDGFISRYSYPKLSVDSWQFSSIPIKKIAVHPQGRLIAIYESDGFGIHQVSLWDWILKKNIFSKRLSDSVVSLSWSAKGTYLFIGNRSMQGIIVLNKQGKLQKIYKQAPGIVFLAATATSEKNIVTYGESGRLIYTEIARRKKVKEFKTEKLLQAPEIINNFKKLIGYKNNKVIEINAITGKKIKEYSTLNAIFATKLHDTKPIWIEKTKYRNQWRIRQGDASSENFSLPRNSKITAARYIKDHMIVGTESGHLYFLSLNINSTVKVEAPLKYSFTDIDDITSDKNLLFILKDGNIYSIQPETKNPILITQGLRTNKFQFYKNGFLLWSDSIKGLPIYYYSLKTKKLQKIVYTKDPIISLSTYKNSLLIVESFKGASVINFNTGRKTFSYTAPGIQNAVQIDDENIIVSKSSIDKAQSPVFIINTKTQETLPISIEGELAFALKQNTERPDKLNCLLISTKPTVKTELLRISLNKKNLRQSKFKAVLSYREEDLDAFLATDKYDILTNLGKNSIFYYNTISKQIKKLPRSYSLSRKAIILNDYFVSLNYGGTISWYDRKSKQLLKTHPIEDNTKNE